jgi:nitrite reductase/ring-hydroxylating ferredoxin subunit
VKQTLKACSGDELELYVPVALTLQKEYLVLTEEGNNFYLIQDYCLFRTERV